MLGLPKSTEFNWRIPKQKFYENLTVSPTLKRVFVEHIRVIWWRNKIAATTMNLAAEDTVTEIEVFEVCLSAPQLDEAVLRQIDKEIPYHILFLLEYESKYQTWTAYKEAEGSRTNVFKVGTYYHTSWMEESAERDARRQELQKQIAALQVKVRREKQLNKQVQMNAELKRELEKL